MDTQHTGYDPNDLLQGIPIGEQTYDEQQLRKALDTAGNIWSTMNQVNPIEALRSQISASRFMEHGALAALEVAKEKFNRDVHRLTVENQKLRNKTLHATNGVVDYEALSDRELSAQFHKIINEMITRDMKLIYSPGGSTQDDDQPIHGREVKSSSDLRIFAPYDASMHYVELKNQEGRGGGSSGARNSEQRNGDSTTCQVSQSLPTRSTSSTVPTSILQQPPSRPTIHSNNSTHLPISMTKTFDGNQQNEMRVPVTSGMNLAAQSTIPSSSTPSVLGPDFRFGVPHQDVIINSTAYANWMFSADGIAGVSNCSVPCPSQQARRISTTSEDPTHPPANASTGNTESKEFQKKWKAAVCQYNNLRKASITSRYFPEYFFNPDGPHVLPQPVQQIPTEIVLQRKLSTGSICLEPYPDLKKNLHSHQNRMILSEIIVVMEEASEKEKTRIVDEPVGNPMFDEVEAVHTQFRKRRLGH